MDQELKAKWVAALRSGEYKQGRNYLRNRDQNTFCCLGVLREIQEPGAHYGVEMTSCLYPKHNAGMSWELMDKLANEMNDQGWSFASIADYIEQNL